MACAKVSAGLQTKRVAVDAHLARRHELLVAEGVDVCADIPPDATQVALELSHLGLPARPCRVGQPAHERQVMCAVMR
jgi:hypothetical protein